MFDCRVLKDVSFSIAPVRGLQTSSLDCTSRVIWIEKSSCSSKSSSKSASSPPSKKRKVEQPSHDLLQGLLEGEREKQSHYDRQVLEPEAKLCVVLSTGFPMMQSCGELSVAITATWKKTRTAGGENTSDRKMEEEEKEIAEIGAATLSHQLLCSGELNLSESCLHLWDGEKFLNVSERAHLTF